MRTASIRFRLTVWYLLCLCSILAVFGVGARMALKNSIYGAVDHELSVRLDDVRDFVTRQNNEKPGHLAHELAEQVETGLGGGLVEMWDSSGFLMFRATGINDSWHNSNPQPYSPDNATIFSTTGSREANARAAVRSFATNGRRYTARVVEPIHQFDEALDRFDGMLLLGVPLMLIVAAFVGFWISGRALAPVDRLTQDAEQIGAMNLSQRLEVPAADDELRRLALTLNKMLARLDEAFERLVQFTGDASHELRAPLTLVHAAAEFSLRGQRSPEESRDAFRKILRESDRMTVLIEDLLTLARGDAGTDDAAVSPIDLSHAANAALDLIRVAAEGKHLAVRVSLPEVPLLVNGDGRSLIRMIFVLLDNAVKYTEEGGWIDLRVASSVAVAEITVIDSGIGIRQEDLPRIWDRFWRADKVRSRNQGGAGLGLAIARSIASRHGAALEATSELGRGSRFTVRVPLARVQDSVAAVSAQRSQ